MAAMVGALAQPSFIQAVCSSKRCSRSSGGARQLRVRVRAAGEEPDLSQQFADFKRRMNASMPEVEQRVATEAPRFRKSVRSGNGWNSGPSVDQMRRQEQQLLNAWTQERLMQLAAGGTMVLVLLLLFAAGGPPSDARCTLPWC